MKKILLIDNYDSFTGNVFHLMKSVTCCEIDIVLNDRIPFLNMEEYSHIILSPGPGLPEEAGDMPRVINDFKETHSILGICLGHQAIASHFGARLVNLNHPLHGHKTVLKGINQSDPILGCIADEVGSREGINVGLYHSWAIDPESLPEELVVGAVSEDGVIMSIYHKELKVYGLQFHPESIITDYGDKIVSNWLKI